MQSSVAFCTPPVATSIRSERSMITRDIAPSGPVAPPSVAPASEGNAHL